MCRQLLHIFNGNANKKSFNVSNENKYVVLDTNRILDSVRNKSKESTLKRMVKIIKKSACLFEQDRLQSKNDEKIYIEWREVARRLDDISVDMDTGERTMSAQEMVIKVLDYVQPSYWRVKELGKIGISADKFCEVGETKESIIVRKAK